MHSSHTANGTYVEAPTAGNRGRFVVLDGWRGICALLVTLHHFAVTGPVYSLALIRNASLFVDFFFFVLSGFVVTHAYSKRIGGPLSAASFLLKRVGRVWPLHLVMLLVLIGLEAARAAMGGTGTSRPSFSDPDSWTSILPNALLLHAFNTENGLTWNVPSWSISVEMGVYVLFAAGLLVFRSRLPWFAIALVALSVVVLAKMPKPYVDATQDFGLFRGLAGFFMGYLVYELRTRRSGLVTSTWLATWLELVASVLTVLFVCAAGGGWLPLLAPFVFAAAVYLFSYECSGLSRLLVTRTSLFLGKVSYSIYMVHYPIVLITGAVCAVLSHRLGIHLVLVGEDGAADKLLNFGAGWADSLATAVFLAVTIGMAVLTYRFIEVPGQEIIRHALPSGRRSRPRPEVV